MTQQHRVHPGPTAMDDYEFDLRGFLIIRNALSPDEVAALNEAYDRFPDLDNGEWYGNAQRRDYTKDTGFELHNVLDCGDPTFDVLIDHPAWIRHVSRYAGEQGTYVQGIMIDESIATSRGSGGHHPVHSGGHDASIRTQYAYRNGAFRCGQVNVLVSLRDVGPGDGATMVVPGSHKSNFMHPLAGDYARGDRMDALPFAIEAHTKAGDALVFVDACMHGAGTRVNEGDRRIVILRYGPPWARSRFGYTISDALLERLTPAAPDDHATDAPAAHRRPPRAGRPALDVPVPRRCRDGRRTRFVATAPEVGAHRRSPEGRGDEMRSRVGMAAARPGGDGGAVAAPCSVPVVPPAPVARRDPGSLRCHGRCVPGGPMPALRCGSTTCSCCRGWWSCRA